MRYPKNPPRAPNYVGIDSYGLYVYETKMKVIAKPSVYGYDYDGDIPTSFLKDEAVKKEYPAQRLTPHKNGNNEWQAGHFEIILEDGNEIIHFIPNEYQEGFREYD